jgi:hypothetical protein
MAVEREVETVSERDKAIRVDAAPNRVADSDIQAGKGPEASCTVSPIFSKSMRIPIPASNGPKLTPCIASACNLKLPSNEMLPETRISGKQRTGDRAVKFAEMSRSVIRSEPEYCIGPNCPEDIDASPADP